MSYTLNFADQTMERVNASASYWGVSVIDFVMRAIERAVEDAEARHRADQLRSQRASEVRARLHALVERSSPREGEPYKFNRADAYPLYLYILKFTRKIELRSPCEFIFRKRPV